MTPVHLWVARSLAIGVLAAVTACSGDAPPAAPPTETSSPPPAPSATTAAPAPTSATGPATPAPPVSQDGPVDVERAIAHLKMLAVDIGSRPAGSDAERRAAQYVAGVLTSQGYTTTIESFTYPARFDESRVTIGQATIEAMLLEGSAYGSATGTLVDAGTGQPEEIPAQARGAIVLMRRGGLPFAQKVANAQQAGAAAVLVVNNEDGPFRGTLGQQRASIPALAIRGEDGDRLRATIGQPVTAEASGGTRTVTSQNVVGRRGESCRAYIGAHYDSVPEGPGANDNASGTATMLEIARVRRHEGLCAVAFGAEETGLNGSRAFVSSNLAGGAVFMLNFDMTARIDGAIIAGDGGLTRSILDILGSDQPLKAGAFPPFASSDHVSFTGVGVPAVTLTSGDDPNIHSPGDTFEAIRKADLQVMLTLGDQALAGMLKTLPVR